MTYHAISRAVVMTALLISTACAQTQNPHAMELCKDPRPQICTQEYNPVCATLNDGEKKTYATGCTACSDPAVKGWVPGECG